jgi:hypothetical protein
MRKEGWKYGFMFTKGDLGDRGPICEGGWASVTWGLPQTERMLFASVLTSIPGRG